MSELILGVVVIALLVYQYVMMKQLITLTKVQKASTLEEYTATERPRASFIPEEEYSEDMMTLDDTPAEWLKEAVTRHTTTNNS